MIFTTNKSLSEWGTVLHDEDLAAAILDRVLERGRLHPARWALGPHASSQCGGGMARYGRTAQNFWN